MPPRLDLRQVGLQRGRVHRDQHVGVVAGRRDVARGELDLERRDPVHRAGRGPDLRREVGQGREVVAEHRGGGGEAIAGQLHAVAGVPREPDDDAFLLFDGLGHAWPAVPTDAPFVALRASGSAGSVTSRPSSVLRPHARDGPSRVDSHHEDTIDWDRRDLRLSVDRLRRLGSGRHGLGAERVRRRGDRRDAGRARRGHRLDRHRRGLRRRRLRDARRPGDRRPARRRDRRLARSRPSPRDPGSGPSRSARPATPPSAASAPTTSTCTSSTGPTDGVPVEESWGAMAELVDAGKVRWIGVSNFDRDADRALRGGPPRRFPAAGVLDAQPAQRRD